MSALRAEGHDLGRLLACSGLARSTYYYALSHPAKPTRPDGEDGLRLPQHRQPRGPAHAQVRRLPAPAPGLLVEGEEEGHEGSEERSVGKSERSVCIFGIVPNPCQLCGGCRKLQIDYLRIVLIHA